MGYPVFWQRAPLNLLSRRGFVNIALDQESTTSMRSILFGYVIYNAFLDLGKARVRMIQITKRLERVSGKLWHRFRRIHYTTLGWGA
jgi:hypothetical protein